MPSDQLAAPFVFVTKVLAAGSINAVQPGMPKPASENGSGMAPHTVRDRPMHAKTGPGAAGVGRFVKSTVNVLPSQGSWPVAAASAGTPAVPAQPAPNWVKAAVTPGAEQRQVSLKSDQPLP